MDWTIMAIAAAAGTAAAMMLWQKRPEPDAPFTDEIVSTTLQGHGPTPGHNTLNRHRPSQAQPSYAAVSVKPGAGACDAAYDASTVRYLKSAAPTLPLESCENGTCDCSLVHHADRRRTAAEGDRRAGIGLKSERYGSSGEPERRRLRGRRSTDRA